MGVPRTALALGLASAVIAGACTDLNPRFRPEMDARVPDTIPDASGSRPDRTVDLAADLNLGGANRDVRNDEGALVGYWRFDDGPGSLRVTDASGRGNHGEVEGLAVATAWVTGKVGFALSFAATNLQAGVRVAATPEIEAMRAFTITAWIHRTELAWRSPWTVASRQFGATDVDVFGLHCTPSDLVATLPISSAGRPTELRAPNAVGLGRWIHAAVTYDGELLTLYADGSALSSLRAPDRLNAAAPPTPVYLGTNKNAAIENHAPFAGMLDEMALFSRALAAAEIKSIFEGASPQALR
ncbi:MAG TPA: LamG domain-containing protein [Polyangia bacterium]